MSAGPGQPKQRIKPGAQNREADHGPGVVRHADGDPRRLRHKRPHNFNHALNRFNLDLWSTHQVKLKLLRLWTVGEEAMAEATIGASLRMMRERRGWTQERLAAEADLSPQAISNIERGVSEPTIATLRVMAGTLGFSIRQFFAADPMPDDDQETLSALKARIEREIQSLTAAELESVLHHIYGIRRFHRY